MAKNIITTDRLVLRPWHLTDAPALFRYAKGDEVGPNAGWPPHKSVADSLAHIRRLRHQKHCYAITRPDDDTPIGCVGLYKTTLSDGHKRLKALELGFSLDPAHWGKGYATEAARALLMFAFDELGLDTVWSSYFEFNEASRHVCEKCGFRYAFSRTAHHSFLNPPDVKEDFAFVTAESFIRAEQVVESRKTT